MALVIADEVEEQFELCGVSTPCLQRRARLEERMAMPGKDAELFAGTHRFALGQYLGFLASAIAHMAGTTRAVCSQKLWFDSMHMCDILAARGLDFSGQATSYATAVLRILWKAENATRTLPSEHLSRLTETLWRQGVAVHAALPQDIDSAERRILRCLGWQVLFPSIHWWLATFFSRLRVLTKQHLTDREESEFQAVVPQLWQQSCFCGTAVVTRAASLGASAPRTLAMGLLGLGCVRAGMLQLHGVRPERIGAAEWEQAYTRVVGPLPAFREDSYAAKIAQIIQLATDSSMDAVRDACGHIVVNLSQSS